MRKKIGIKNSQKSKFRAELTHNWRIFTPRFITRWSRRIFFRMLTEIISDSIRKFTTRRKIRITRFSRSGILFAPRIRFIRSLTKSERVDFINTFIRQYEQGGRLPVWELAANETDTMIGYHAVSVIADAMAKGIKGFDYEKAFEAAKHSAELNHFGLEAYRKRGYISMEDEQESVSKTLEYAYNDFCIAQMAKILWKSENFHAVSAFKCQIGRPILLK